MGLYQRLLRTVSQQALLGSEIDERGTAGLSRPPRTRAPNPGGADRLLRTPLLFETLEPRVLLSGDPITAAA
jgi:hypothetical protein